MLNPSRDESFQVGSVRPQLVHGEAKGLNQLPYELGVLKLMDQRRLAAGRVDDGLRPPVDRLPPVPKGKDQVGVDQLFD